MLSRLSESPSLEPSSSSDPPEAMSLTEVAGVTQSPYLLHPPLPYAPDASSQINLRHTSFASPLMVMPPLQTRQPESFGSSFPRHDPAFISRTGHHHSRYSLAPFGNTLNDPQSSPSVSSLNSAPGVMTVPARQMRTDDRTAQGYTQVESVSQKRETSEDSILFSATPPRGPLAPLRPAKLSPANQRRSVEASQYRRTPRRTSAEASRDPAGKSGLIGTYDPRCSLEYEMIIRQQPLAARACGFGERDRRVIDPPPILQMIVRDPRGTKKDLSPELRFPHSVVHCELWNADADTEETAIPELGERRQQRRLVGTLVASPFYGRDESGVIGCFFPFPDLSCRTIGRYRLRFVLLLADPASMRPGDRLPFRGIATSSVFDVYTAKTFPGMEPSSELTKRLKGQGCLISIKKGHQRGDKMKDSQGKDENDEVEEDDDDDERSSKGPEKRQKV